MSNQEQRSKQFWGEFERLIPKLAEASAEIAIDQLDVAIKRRIWETYTTADLEPLKRGLPYDSAYAKFRAKLKKQTAQIDLSFEGDLRRSVKTTKSTLGQQIIFNAEKQTDKARGIEETWNQKIFFASDQEAEDALDFMSEFFLTGIDELNKRYSQSA